ncbi:MAG: NfeD family protein [Desulfobulbus sp.]|nr:MAG: NfeD family protein [Desulfobulbus sp.]
MVVSSVLIWFLVGIVCFLVELALPGFIIFFFGIGSWCVALVLAFTDISLTTQLIVFLCSSLATLVVLRSKLRTVFLGGVFEQNDSVIVDSVVGTGTVTESILPPATGRIKYGGSFWTAVADEEIVKGTVVDVVEKNDLTVKVRPLTSGKENNNE